MTETWRNDSGLKSENRYKKKFAWLPVMCHGNQKVWLKSYYKFSQVWYSSITEDGYYHIDYIANLTEEEYMVRPFHNYAVA
jgi:hypothetical protein